MSYSIMLYKGSTPDMLLLFVLLLLVRATVPGFQNGFPNRHTVALCVGYPGWKPADSTVLFGRQMEINF